MSDDPTLQASRGARYQTTVADLLFRMVLRVRPRLSTSIYGDWGALLFRMEEDFREVYGSDAERRLSMDLSPVPLHVRNPYSEALEDLVLEHEPLRFGLDEDDRTRLLDCCMQRMARRSWNPQDADLFRSIATEHLAHGWLWTNDPHSPTWVWIAEMDLEAELGPFLRLTL